MPCDGGDGDGGGSEGISHLRPFMTGYGLVMVVMVMVVMVVVVVVVMVLATFVHW